MRLTSYKTTMIKGQRSTSGAGHIHSVVRTGLEVMVVLLAFVFFGSILWKVYSPENNANARNALRKAHVTTISHALYSYTLHHRGEYPDQLSVVPKHICAEWTFCSYGLNFSDMIMWSYPYLVRIPEDPLRPIWSEWSGYQVSLTSSGRVIVSAPLAEAWAVIQIIR